MTKELNFNVLVTEKFKQRYKFSLTINLKKKAYIYCKVLQQQIL